MIAAGERHHSLLILHCFESKMAGLIIDFPPNFFISLFWTDSSWLTPSKFALKFASFQKWRRLPKTVADFGFGAIQKFGKLKFDK